LSVAAAAVIAGDELDGNSTHANWKLVVLRCDEAAAFRERMSASHAAPIPMTRDGGAHDGPKLGRRELSSLCLPTRMGSHSRSCPRAHGLYATEIKTAKLTDTYKKLT